MDILDVDTVSYGIVALLLLVSVLALRATARARRRADKLAASAARLPADVGRELRAPLATLLATLQAALGRERSREEYRAALDASERLGRDCRRIVEDALETSDAKGAAGPSSASSTLRAALDRSGPRTASRATRGSCRRPSRR